MRASDPGKRRFSHARSVQFTFTGVTETLVTPLGDGAISIPGPRHHQPVRFVSSDHNKHAYVVTSVLKSDSIIAQQTQPDASIAADIPSIQTAVGVDVPSGIRRKQRRRTFKENRALTFGFKMCPTYGDGHWHVLRSTKRWRRTCSQRAPPV
jgi:hypothetical protein